MSEFCPRCTMPLETGQDPDRLCAACGWFGDQSEALLTPPQGNLDNPYLAAAHGLAWFRETCRCELMAEQLCQQASKADADAKVQLSKFQGARRHAAYTLVQAFATLWSGAASRQRLRRINGVVPWPANWADRHYNGGREPCDLLVGPCSCGDWHSEREDWVRAVLLKHNAEIIDGDLP